MRIFPPRILPPPISRRSSVLTLPSASASVAVSSPFACSRRASASEGLLWEATSPDDPGAARVGLGAVERCEQSVGEYIEAFNFIRPPAAKLVKSQY